MEGVVINNSFLGFDISTQAIKVTAVDGNLNILKEEQIQYDLELPEFRTQNGVHKGTETNEVTAPTIMWVKALDMVLEKLKKTGFDLGTVRSLSGCGQQHGSVYWKIDAHRALKNLNPDKTLHEQLKDSFSVDNSPIWMDASTTEQCKAFETLFSAQKLANITGSRAYERFTGPQIKKIYDFKPLIYNNTERISLVSSFAASLFLGDYAPIDYSDGSGMNLMDIFKKDWSEDLLHLCAPALRKKLGKPVPSFSVLGTISPYFVKRFGFSSNCQVIAFTGDNPATLVALKMKPDDIVVSLGTSDTVFFKTTNPVPTLEGHVLCSPTDITSYFVMLCFKNGSLTRERIRDKVAEGSWDKFAERLSNSPKGNNGNIGMYFDLKEIIPFVQGEYRFNSLNENVASFSNEIEARALIEGQFLSKIFHTTLQGICLTKNSRILATGGAATNLAILQILADVFNCQVYTLNIANSASMGAAYLAFYGTYSGLRKEIHEVFGDGGSHLKLATSPTLNALEVYKPMVARYQHLEKIVTTDYQNVN